MLLKKSVVAIKLIGKNTLKKGKVASGTSADMKIATGDFFLDSGTSPELRIATSDFLHK